MSERGVRTRTKTPAPSITSAGARTIVRTKLYGQDESEIEDYAVERFEVEPAYVKVSAGVTRNLGNYESLRLDVMVTVPCYREHVNETFTAVAEQVSNLLADELAKYSEGGS